jgi:hypothetical protein
MLDCFATLAMTGRRMRRSVLALLLLVSACAPRVEQQLAPQPAPAPVQQQPRHLLIGFTAAQLISTFGAPALQVREGSSLKLQFRNSQCVLDAYLYPSGGGAPKVTYVDSRLPSGEDTDQAACVAALGGRS